jgi:hypothetical protein
MRYIPVSDPITNAQNEGTACPHCGSASGHYGYCATLTGQSLQDYANGKPLPVVLPITEYDVKLLAGMNIKIEDNDTKENHG